MTDKSQSRGKTTLAPDVLLSIAKLTTLSVDGVSRMAPVPGGIDRLFRRGSNEGVRIDVEDNVVYIDLYIILKHNINIREVSRNVQQQVARAISEMVGMDVGHINLHIEDIDYSGSEA